MQIGVLVIGGSEEDKATIRESLIGYALWFSSNEEEVHACINEHQEIQIALFFLHTGNQLLPVLLEHAVRTIILSYPGNDKEEIEALALGASDYLRKPLHPEMLRIRINFHIQVIESAARKAVVTSQHIWFDTFLWQAPVGVAVYRGVDRTHLEMVNANSTLEQILDRTKEELMALNWQSIIHPDDLEDVSVKHGRFFRHEIPGYETEKRFIRPDGSIIWVNLTVSRLYTGRYCCDDCVGILKDITQQKLLETSYKEQEREMSSFLSQLPGMAYRCSFDESWTMQFVSSGCENLIGYTPDELIDNKVISYNDVIVPSYRKKVHDTWSSVAEKDSSIAQEYEIITKDGQSKWVYDTGKGILDKTGQLLAIEGMVFDISEQQKQERILSYRHNHDEWTNLPNRRYMVSFLRSIRDKQEKGNHTLLSINLAAVHSLSLIHGFLYSRNLVKQIVNALCVLSDASHVLFSSYEYQLVFFIKNPAGPDYVLSFARLVSKKVASFLREERVGWGIGIVAFDDSPLEVCLTNLLVASEKGFAGFDEGQEICMYGEAMQEEVRRRTVLEQELAAFVKEEPLGTSTFYLQFQPIWDVKTHMITGFEALSRMHSHSLGTVSPVEFIEIAEKAKLIVPLGNVIIAKALDFLSALEREGFVHVGVSINISAIQLMHKDFMRDVMDAIERIQVNTANITLEVTESVFISEFQQVNDLFFQLQEKGISISLDDFGTGYSTLSRERELNVNCLKIDKTFIDKLTTLHEKEAITADIISMAHKLGHTVIAEGVEYEEQRAYLEKYGCDKIQGFLYNKPLDLDAALLLLKQTNQTENR